MEKQTKTRRREEARDCAHCGARYYTSRKTRHCGPRCAALARHAAAGHHPQREYTCPVCARRFWRYVSETDSDTPCCSHNCRYERQRRS